MLRYAAVLCTLAAAAPLPAAEAPRALAVTIDDLPFVGPGSLADVQRHTAKLLGALRAHHVSAIGFVNEDKLLRPRELDARVALLGAWLDAGMELGNHGFGHLGLQTTPLQTAEEAVLKGEVVTRWLLKERGQEPRYYRHPFTQTGPTREVKERFEGFLAEHGYTVAPFTIEHDDFVFAAVYADARQRGDRGEAERVRAAYLANLDPAFDTFESMADELFGHPVPQVFLIHANALNADTMDAMLRRIETRGYRFVSLAEAMKDDAYRSPDGFIGPHGPSWLRRWSMGLDRSTRLRGQPDPPAWILEMYARLRGQ